MEVPAKFDEHAVVDIAPCPSRGTTPGYVSDYDTLSPAPLSPYNASTPPFPGLITPQTPQSSLASPVSPYVNVALQDLIQAGQMLNTCNSNNKDTVREQKPQDLPSLLETTSLLAHLATFGVLGVLIRFGLGKLFDDVGHVVSPQIALFHDLPANMFGCFFMGWVGCVMKKDISHFSELLAIGFSTGLMGSITTFSSWIVKLVAVMTKGFWLIGIVGLIVGMELSFMSLLVGIHTAQWLRCWIVRFVNPKLAADNVRRKFWTLIVFLALGIGSWILFLVLTVLDSDDFERRSLWLACVVSPPGVWLRCLLARQNGKGIGSSKRLDWFPWGTLAANLLACAIGYVCSVVQLARVDYESRLWTAAIQLGTLGCLSTVSTFVVEVYNFGKDNSKQWRAYAYSIASLLPAFVLGIVLYSSIVWAKDYDY